MFAGSVMGITQSAYDPASRVRFIQYIPYLERAGWRVSHRPNLPDRQWRSPLRNRVARGLHYRAGRVLMKLNRMRDISDARGFDVVFCNRDLAGNGVHLERHLWRCTQRIVYDFDDAIFTFPKTEPTVRWMCEHAAWVTPGNAYLAEYARQFNGHVEVLPTVIDTDRYTPKVYADIAPDTLVRVGWSGSDQSIRETLFPYLPLLVEAQKLLHFELVIISNTRPTLPVSGLRWSFHPWSAESEGALGSVMDVGIMPLVDDVFQRGKCGLKLLQYMAAALPTIASPVGVNAEITVDGCTGFLASAPDDWLAALEVLVTSPRRRRAMGEAGRDRCERHYSIQRWLPVLLGILDHVATSTHA
ncbi:MAG TPA: glycosyltransferase family 4 protein [Gemmatimonadaceae bacterium]